jgi:formylglycine-generating enzyme required for sulfatase activity
MKSVSLTLTLVGVALCCLSAININHVKSATIINKEKTNVVANVYPEINEVKPCGEEQVLVDGEYCPFVKETCLKWRDVEKDHPLMCDKFEYPTKCLAKTTHLKFCIDKYEAQDKKGEVPEVFIDWFTAKDKCEYSGKRLCEVSELTLACEGPDRKPMPWGYSRDVHICNIGNMWIDPDNNPFEKIDKRKPSGYYNGCKSDYGVYDLIGNVDEWSLNSEGSMNKAPFKSALFGGHYVNGIRNRCRDNNVPSITTSHGPTAKNYEISYRCCSDAK